jgi:hypothetical protein
MYFFVRIHKNAKEKYMKEILILSEGVVKDYKELDIRATE